MIDLHHGDCLEILKTLPDNSVDSLVTDPPAGISFMNLKFDDHRGGRDAWVAWLREILEECQRVMKPGAIGFVWSLPRTQHWTALACEDAGFEIWDNLGAAHVKGSGFPKGQAIDRLVSDRGGDSERWDGWRTPALKPAIEFWIAVRKPLDGSCVDNVLTHGVGGINVDAGRVGCDWSTDANGRHSRNVTSFYSSPQVKENHMNYGRDGRERAPPGLVIRAAELRAIRTTRLTEVSSMALPFLR